MAADKPSINRKDPFADLSLKIEQVFVYSPGKLVSELTCGLKGLREVQLLNGWVLCG